MIDKITRIDLETKVGLGTKLGKYRSNSVSR